MVRIEKSGILNGDALHALKELSDESVDCCVTSPPYWALRDYGVDGQLGLEPTFQEYITKLCDIFDEAKRVLKKTGTCWVNMGDTYISKGESRHAGYTDPKYTNGRVGRMSEANALPQSIPEKCLAQIPSRFAIEMTNRGWILRNEIIWYKPNCMPSSVKDRFTVDFEKVFFFVKNKKYWFETQYDDSIWYEKDKRAITGGITKSGKSVSEQGNQYAINKSGSFNKMAGKRNKRCVWKVTTKPFKEAHFATYPEALIEPMIKAGCPEFICKKCGKPREKIIERKRISRKELPKDDPRYRPNEYSGTYGEINGKSDAGYCEQKVIGYTDCGCNAGFEGGIVIDPFFGAGTTGVVALKQNKRYVGIELNREYIEMANKRLSSVTNKLI